MGLLLSVGCVRRPGTAEAAIPTLDDTAACRMLTHFIKEAALSSGKDADSLIERQVSLRCRNYLRRMNDYDCGGYAVWLFRIGGNDPDDAGQARTLHILPEKENWYAAVMTDYGKTDTVRVQLLLQGGRMLIDSVVNKDYR